MTEGFVGILTVDLHLAMSESLKDKRSALQRLRAQLVKATGCSVAETGDHELRRRATLTVAVVARDAGGAQRLLDEAVRVVERGPFEPLAFTTSLHSAEELGDRMGV